MPFGTRRTSAETVVLPRCSERRSRTSDADSERLREEARRGPARPNRAQVRAVPDTRAGRGDQVDPGNAPRWPLGFGSAGLVKNGALGNFIHSNWPYTTVRVCPGKIGAPRLSGEGPPEWEALDTLLETADLVVDATAEVGMAYFLSDLTRDKGVPLVVASTTEGGWGGRIVHLGTAPDDPCWMCVLKHIEDQTIPVPPADPDPATGNVHPAGCVTPTFTGTGFDVASISLAATRLIASVLTRGAPGGYPAADWNAAIYEFRDADHAKPGLAQPFVLTRHPGCESCNLRASG